MVRNLCATKCNPYRGVTRSLNPAPPVATVAYVRPVSNLPELWLKNSARRHVRACAHMVRMIAKAGPVLDFLPVRGWFPRKKRHFPLQTLAFFHRCAKNTRHCVLPTPTPPHRRRLCTRKKRRFLLSTPALFHRRRVCTKQKRRFLLHRASPEEIFHNGVEFFYTGKYRNVLHWGTSFTSAREKNIPGASLVRCMYLEIPGIYSVRVRVRVHPRVYTLRVPRYIPEYVLCEYSGSTRAVPEITNTLIAIALRNEPPKYSTPQVFRM